MDNTQKEKSAKSELMSKGIQNLAVIIIFSLAFGIGGGYLSQKLVKQSKPMLYSLNLSKIVNMERKNMSGEELKNPSINPKVIKTQISKFVRDVNTDALHIAGKNGVIVVQQAVIGGSAKNITVKVEQMLTKQGDL